MAQRARKSASNAEDTGDVGSIPESGISSGGGNGNLLQYSQGLQSTVTKNLYLLGAGKRFLFNILTFQL